MSLLYLYYVQCVYISLWLYLNYIVYVGPTIVTFVLYRACVCVSVLIYVIWFAAYLCVCVCLKYVHVCVFINTVCVSSLCWASASSWRWAELVSLPPGPRIGSRRHCLYSVSFAFLYFSFHNNYHHGRQDGRLTRRTTPRFHPFILIWVDRMKSNCGVLRFAGEVRLRATTTCWISVSHLNVLM